MVLCSQFLNLDIDSCEVFVHVFHLLCVSFTSSPIVVMQDIPSAGDKFLKLLLNVDALSEIATEKPGRLFLDAECD